MAPSCLFGSPFCHFLSLPLLLLNLAVVLPASNGNSAGKRVVLARVFIFKASEKPETVASQPIGVVDIAQTDSGKTQTQQLCCGNADFLAISQLNGTINGLVPGNHGFHFHQFGDLSQSCVAAGAHFNPHGKRHGAQSSTERHVGDLGNLVANDDGVAVVDVRDHLVTLNGVNSVVGRALVVHERGDDMGQGGNEESAKTGNAGKRVGCGVVGVVKEQ